jgi:5-methylcytosine-specific restriction endonuclease McrA
MQSNVLERRVLVLNKNYLAIGTTDLPRALSLVWKRKKGKGRADIINEDMNPVTWSEWSAIAPKDNEQVVRSAMGVYRIPEIIKLNFYDQPPLLFVPFSRNNLFKRDNFCCQYCGKKPNTSDLTIDHIIPRKLGGKTSWTNCVLACFSCNQMKMDTLPENVRTKKFPDGMKTLKEPVRPKMQDLSFKLKHESWKCWLSDMYWNIELENDNDN